MIRGKGQGLEIVIDGDPAVARAALREQLAQKSGFYAGSRATAVYTVAADASELDALRAELDAFGIVLDDVRVEERVGTPAEPRERVVRPLELSEGARSLVADFAGARSDLATRRTARGRTRPPIAPVPDAPAVPAMLYHRGTLRGGQSLTAFGHLVVIGDVNPGAELIAGGDIVVLGALRGVAHAGAQGDGGARVLALELAPTQLRIATVIAVDGESGRRAPRSLTPEEARIDGDRIVIHPYGEVRR